MPVADTSLRSLIGLPQVGRTLAASLVARLPYTAIGLLLILRVRETGRGYAEGGAVAAAFIFGLALVGPVVARRIDRHGQRAVLLPCAALSALALVAAALVPDRSPLAVLAALAALAGTTHPPLGGAMRALWPGLVPAERRHAVFALEAVGVELTFIAGPLLLVGALAGTTSPSVALIVAALLLVTGTVAFTSAPSSRGWRPAAVARTVSGALASTRLRTMIVAAACMGASFGAIEVATTAHAEEHGSPALVGPLLAAWAAGSLIGGVAIARRRAPADPRRRLAALLLATALADALVALAPRPALLAPALLLAGSCIAPAFATLYAMVADLAREGTLTESYTWIGTGVTAGAALGSAVGGVAIDAVSTHAALGGAAAMVLAAFVVVTTTRRTPLPAPA